LIDLFNFVLKCADIKIKKIGEGVLVMLEVTKLATQNLKSYMAQNNIDSALRVAIMGGGCALFGTGSG
jgi:hypothetical protein